MRKRILWGILFLAVTVALMACGGGKYDDANDVSNQFAEATENYVNDIAKADSASAVARAINTYADKVEKLGPKMRAMLEKYPELKDRNNIPEEMKESRKRQNALASKMGQALMTTMMKYGSDPQVMQAQRHLQEARKSSMKKK